MNSQEDIPNLWNVSLMPGYDLIYSLFYDSNPFFVQIKCVYIASLNDQVVPIYSGIFTAANHPSILRALFIDGEAYR
jgi:hypothetical protein